MAVTNESPKNKSGCAEYCCCCFRRRRQQETTDPTTTPNVSEDNAPTKVPFYGDLPKDLKAGKVICISSLILPSCLRFSINLMCGKGPEADIGFHLNPRLEQKFVVRNSRINGRWGVEETKTKQFDFEQNKKANVNIFIGHEQFFVSVNGKHYFAFAFRVPLSQLTGIQIEGLVDVLGVTYGQYQTYPGGDHKEIPPLIPTIDELGEKEEQDISTPFTGLLPRGLKLGWQLEIYGRVKILPHSFYVNLQEGYHFWPHPIVPLHLNPRFVAAAGENVFVRNSYINGWGSEERAPGFQFSPNTSFNMAIRRGADHFSVWVDGKLTGEFRFRGDVDKIDTVYIQGDVVIRKILMSDRITDSMEAVDAMACNDEW